jgi:hypothetical protein
MKALFFLLFLSVQVNILSAQVVDNLPWCPPGATWVYAFPLPWQYPIPYSVYKYEKDTIMKGRVVKKINHYVLHVAPTFVSGVPSAPWIRIPATGAPPLTGSYYMYNSNDSIYLYYNGVFNHIYSFNLQMGSQFVIQPDNVQLKPLCNFTSDTCTVKTVTQTTIGNRAFKEYYLNYRRKWGFGDIINKIGPTNILIPFIHCESSGIALSYNNLVYYYDDLRGEVAEPTACQFLGMSCQSFISSTETLPQKQIDQDISVYPNPTSGDLLFKGLQSNTSYLVTVYDATGKEILKSMKLSDDEPQLFMGNLINGLYFIKIQNGLQRNYLKFLKN